MILAVNNDQRDVTATLNALGLNDISLLLELMRLAVSGELNDDNLTVGDNSNVPNTTEHKEKQPSLMSNKDNVYVEHIGDLLRHLATNDQNTYLTMIDTCAKDLFSAACGITNDNENSVQLSWSLHHPQDLWNPFKQRLLSLPLGSRPLNLFSVHFLLFVLYPFTDFALIRVSVEILHCLSGSSVILSTIPALITRSCVQGPVPIAARNSS